MHRAMPRPAILAKATAFCAGLQVWALERSGRQELLDGCLLQGPGMIVAPFLCG